MFAVPLDLEVDEKSMLAIMEKVVAEYATAVDEFHKSVQRSLC